MTNAELRVIARLKMTHNLRDSQRKAYDEATSAERIIAMMDKIFALENEVKLLNKALDDAYP